MPTVQATVSTYLDAVKAALGVTSDYELAKSLGVSRQRVSNWRSGRSAPDFDIQQKFGDILNVPGGWLRVHIDIDVARDPKRLDYWYKVVRLVSKIPLAALKKARFELPGLLAVVGAALFAQPSPALAGFNNNLFAASTPHCVREATVIHIAARLWRWLCSWWRS